MPITPDNPLYPYYTGRFKPIIDKLQEPSAMALYLQTASPKIKYSHEKLGTIILGFMRKLDESPKNKQNQDCVDFAMADLSSAVTALADLLRWGVDPSDSRPLAYIMPRKGKPGIKATLSYHGEVWQLREAGIVEGADGVTADVVYDGDKFELDKKTGEYSHTTGLSALTGGKIVLYYVALKLSPKYATDRKYAIGYLNIADANAFAATYANTSYGPWSNKLGKDEMCKKVCVRRAMKFIISSLPDAPPEVLALIDGHNQGFELPEGDEQDALPAGDAKPIKTVNQMEEALAANLAKKSVKAPQSAPEQTGEVVGAEVVDAPNEPSAPKPEPPFEERSVKMRDYFVNKLGFTAMMVEKVAGCALDFWSEEQLGYLRDVAAQAKADGIGGQELYGRLIPSETEKTNDIPF